MGGMQSVELDGHETIGGISLRVDESLKSSSIIRDSFQQGRRLAPDIERARWPVTTGRPAPWAWASARAAVSVQASTTAPWKEGYEKALEVRDALHWGNEPLPDLGKWMKSNHVAMTSRALSSTIDLVAARTMDNRASVVLDPQTQSHLHREIAQATAMGHILFDVTPVAVDGTWEHWPTAARARAFAAMLSLPDDGVRDVLAGRTNLGAEDVKRVMDRFKTGPYATTYHLKNRGFIGSDERRIEILQELAA